MKADHFKRLVEIQSLVWKGDDLMNQEDLFALQDKLGELLLDVATPNQKIVLAAKFPWLYREVTK